MLAAVKLQHLLLCIASVLSIVVACGHGPTEGDESPPDPAPSPQELDPGEIEAPIAPPDLAPADQREANAQVRRMRASDILGETRRELESQVGPASGAQEDWAHYDQGGGFDVQFLGDEGRASRVRYVLTANRCMEAARAIGFDDAGPPLRRRERCEWPGQSRRHRLGPNVSGRLLFDMGVFEVWPR